MSFICFTLAALMGAVLWSITHSMALVAMWALVAGFGSGWVIDRMEGDG